MSDLHLTVRAAGTHDAGALRRLAAPARRLSPRGHVLLAERDGVAIAAIALTSGVVLTDPSVATTDAVHRLRAGRHALMRQGADAGPAAFVLRRLAGVAA